MSHHHNKGKSITTSVPSLAIRFNANAEEIEEFYQSEEESATDKSNNENRKSIAGGLGDPETSPLRSYLPRVGKRSTSVDTSLVGQDSSPPSDPWKFFADIKGKITKSVEETITEIKQRNQEGDGLSKKSKLVKDRDNCSLSDSEDISESSISKTCGMASTTEGVEMSSDDETPSFEKDKKPPDTPNKSKSSPKNQPSSKYIVVNPKNKKPKEGTISFQTLGNIYEISTGLKAFPSKSSLSDEPVEVESGVEAVEDFNYNEQLLAADDSQYATLKDSKILPSVSSDITSVVAEEIDNLAVDENNVLNIKQVSGNDVRQRFINENKDRTFYAPEGFVDLRSSPDAVSSWWQLIYNCRYIIIFIGIVLFYFWTAIPLYTSGFLAGVLSTLAIIGLYRKIFCLNIETTELAQFRAYNSKTILEIPAVKEYQPVTKFEGWMNEYPDVYNPQTYHICQTQSVYVRLQGNLLRISHTRSKIPKRAMWNEPKLKLAFFQHRIYNLLGAKITLLPEGLNKKRHWSKKYPIRIALIRDQMNFEYCTSKEKILPENDSKPKKECEEALKGKKQKGSFPPKTYPSQPQVFSKLTEEEEEFDLESSSSQPSSPSALEDEVSLDVSLQEDIKLIEEAEKELINVVYDDDDRVDDDVLSLEDWSMFTPDVETPTETHLYMFGRTAREKEDWYRRFVAATHKGAPLSYSENTDLDARHPISDTLINAVKDEEEYLKYMAKFQKGVKPEGIKQEEVYQAENVLWINALIGRILFDCVRHQGFKDRVKERIQRKLCSLKLPYFIEQLSISELVLGTCPPLIHKASKPVIDQRGLWIDLDITFDDIIILVLQTKLNLMKLKQPQAGGTNPEDNPAAKWENSDVEDTAESSTDEETNYVPVATKVLDDGGNPIVGLGGTSNTSKKFIKMVDKLKDSKFFQAATDNRYIKKAMEGVSNTDLGLKVEVKGLAGTLVLNMPPPPSDRLWIGFRPTPKLWLKAHPIVGERNITFLKQLMTWIEKKLSQEFHKVLVLPNMEDILIPVMSPKLPE